MKIYVASSWRNHKQPEVVRALREAGHEVYDFRDPETSFQWSEVDPSWRDWSVAQFVRGLVSPKAGPGFKADLEAMHRANVCVMVTPCGASSHLEAGWFVGRGKPVAILLHAKFEPELMYAMADIVTGSEAELVAWLSDLHLERDRRSLLPLGDV